MSNLLTYVPITAIGAAVAGFLLALSDDPVYCASCGDTIPDSNMTGYCKDCQEEQALAMATSVLSPYLDDIKAVSDTSLQGRFYPERGQGSELLTLIDQEKWSILVNTPVPAKLEGLSIVEPGYNLISIQVVAVQS